jgi:HEAT repeat protein
MPDWTQVRIFLALIVAAIAANTKIPLAQQAPGAGSSVTEEAILVYQGWRMLSDGDAGQAAQHAAKILVTYPRSIAGLTLLVEAEIVRAGPLVALDAYERWLGNRKIEDGYVIRTVARAMLRELIKSSDAGARLEALKALAADGDDEALGLLKQPADGGRLPEMFALAAIGEERSVRGLIAQLGTGIGSRRPIIEALGRSRNPLAIPPLTKLLTDESLDLRSAAATALGRLGAKETVSAMVPLLMDSQPFPVRFSAAGALHRLGDPRGTAFLRKNLSSDHEMVRGQAAEELAAVAEDTSWVPVAKQLIASPDPEMRLLAARLIAPQDEAQARAVFENLMTEQNPAIREAAGHALVNATTSDFASLRRRLRGDPVGRALAAGRVLELTKR